LPIANSQLPLPLPALLAVAAGSAPCGLQLQLIADAHESVFFFIVSNR
jgi:hypothetical protein